MARRLAQLELKKDTPEEPLFLDRYFEVEIDTKAEGDAVGVIKGYASLFGQKDRGNDVVEKGAFTKSIKGRSTNRIPMLYGHLQSSLPIGVWTLIKEDAKGLWVEGKLAMNSEAGRQMYEVLKGGAEMGISIGYRTAVWEYDEKSSTRSLKEVDLFEISLVPIPMLDSARVTQVKADQVQDEPDAMALALKAFTDALDNSTAELAFITALQNASASLS